MLRDDDDDDDLLSDFIYLYPWVNSFTAYPVGGPTEVVEDPPLHELKLERGWGIYKVRILPPRDRKRAAAAAAVVLSVSLLQIWWPLCRIVRRTVV